MVFGQDVRVIPEYLHHMQHQVPEIGRVELLQPVLVRGVELGRVAAGEVAGLERADPVRRLAPVFPALDHAHQRLRGPTLGIHMRRFHHLLEDAELVVGIEDREARSEADQGRVPPQHARAERVERAKPQSLDRLVEDRADPLAHLARRLVGEGDRQDLARVGAVGDQDMGESRGQHPRLAGARACQHQHRPVHAFHGQPLLRVQAGQVFGHAGEMRVVTCRI